MGYRSGDFSHLIAWPTSCEELFNRIGEIRMTLQLSSKLVWDALGKEIFAVLGVVTGRGEARTVGIVYVVHERKIYISTRSAAWKVRHIQANPHVSLTVPIHKQIFWLPWIKIPAATITFSGTAVVLEPGQLDQAALAKLFRGLQVDAETLAGTSVIEITPRGEFVTYGVGVSLMEMRQPEKARGRAPVG
jgi:hypothetical protein